MIIALEAGCLLLERLAQEVLEELALRRTRASRPGAMLELFQAAQQEPAALFRLSGRRHVGRPRRILCDGDFQRFSAKIVYFLWRPLLSDPNDDMVVEVTVASGSDTIATHNLRDFREAKPLGLRVLAPGPFIRHILET